MAIKSYSKRTGRNEAVKYEVMERYGELDTDGKYVKELRLVKWGTNDPKYDIRGWMTDEDGEEKMQKGITLDAEELMSLYEILKTMVESEEEEEK